MTKLWHAKETGCVIGPAITTPGTTTSMYGQVVAAAGETQIESVMKNVTISDPEGQVDLENFLGVTAVVTGTTIGNFQNSELAYKPFGVGTISGTLVVTDVAKLEPYYMGTTATAITNGKRYQPGNFGTNTERQALAVGVKLYQVGALNTAGTKFVSIVLNNAIITKLGDYKLSGPDGTWEVDFEAKCLPKDFYVDFITSGT